MTQSTDGLGDKPDRHHANSLSDVVSAGGATAARVLERARRLQQLSEAVRAMDAPWASALRVGNIRDGAAVLFADNAAAATRAKLESRRIADCLRAEGVDCARLIFRVRPARQNAT